MIRTEGNGELYKIAVVEDNDLIRNMIKVNLDKKGFLTRGFPDAESLLEKSKKELYDLLVLDIMLPGMTGLELLQEIRKNGLDTPVLMLTIKGEIQYKIGALDMGADDYLVKPFNIEELLARIKALLRRSLGKPSTPSTKQLLIGNHRVDLSNLECANQLGKIKLSEKEVKLLAFFASRPGETISRADILEEVWGMDVSPTPRTVDNFILKFRKIFEENPERPSHFISVRNKGYRFEK